MKRSESASQTVLCLYVAQLGWSLGPEVWSSVFPYGPHQLTNTWGHEEQVHKPDQDVPVKYFCPDMDADSVPKILAPFTCHAQFETLTVNSVLGKSFRN